jgi:hypothetical protein
MRTVDAEVTKVHFETEVLFTRHGSEFSQRGAWGLKARERRNVCTAMKSAYSLVLTGRWGFRSIRVTTTYSSKAHFRNVLPQKFFWYLKNLLYLQTEILCACISISSWDQGKLRNTLH